MQLVLQDSFFRWGWLLPIALPLMQVGGRAAYLILAGIYALWGVLAFYRLDFRLNTSHRTALLLYTLLLLSYLISAVFAQDSIKALDKWITFSYQSLVFPFTLVALNRVRDGVTRLGKGLGIMGLAALLAVYVRLGLEISQPGFEAQFDMREDNLPWLAPFIVLWIRSLGPGYTILLFLAGVALIVYIVGSEGRSALLALAVAVAVYELLVNGWKTSRALFSAIIILLLGLLAQGDRFLRSAQNHSGLEGILTAFTSFRSTLWQNAITHPPESLWWGVGMGNTRYFTEVVQIGSLHYAHLHNVFLDTWYETGWIGLGALLLFIGFPLQNLAQAWRYLNSNQRRLAGTYLAAVAALIAASLFSFSYSSRQFAMYLPLMFAALLHLAAPED